MSGIPLDDEQKKVYRELSNEQVEFYNNLSDDQKKEYLKIKLPIEREQYEIIFNNQSHAGRNAAICVGGVFSEIYDRGVKKKIGGKLLELAGNVALEVVTDGAASEIAAPRAAKAAGVIIDTFQLAFDGPMWDCAINNAMSWWTGEGATCKPGQYAIGAGGAFGVDGLVKDQAEAGCNACTPIYGSRLDTYDILDKEKKGNLNPANSSHYDTIMCENEDTTRYFRPPPEGICDVRLYPQYGVTDFDPLGKINNVNIDVATKRPPAAQAPTPGFSYEQRRFPVKSEQMCPTSEKPEDAGLNWMPGDFHGTATYELNKKISESNNISRCKKVPGRTTTDGNPVCEIFDNNQPQFECNWDPILNECSLGEKISDTTNQTWGAFVKKEVLGAIQGVSNWWDNMDRTEYKRHTDPVWGGSGNFRALKRSTLDFPNYTPPSPWDNAFPEKKATPGEDLIPPRSDYFKRSGSAWRLDSLSIDPTPGFTQWGEEEPQLSRYYFKEEFENTNVCQTDDMRMAGPESSKTTADASGQTVFGGNRDDGVVSHQLSNYCCPNPPGAAVCPRFNSSDLEMQKWNVTDSGGISSENIADLAPTTNDRGRIKGELDAKLEQGEEIWTGFGRTIMTDGDGWEGGGWNDDSSHDNADMKHYWDNSSLWQPDGNILGHDYDPTNQISTLQCYNKRIDTSTANSLPFKRSPRSFSGIDCGPKSCDPNKTGSSSCSPTERRKILGYDQLEEDDKKLKNWLSGGGFMIDAKRPEYSPTGDIKRTGEWWPGEVYVPNILPDGKLNINKLFGATHGSERVLNEYQNEIHRQGVIYATPDSIDQENVQDGPNRAIMPTGDYHGKKWETLEEKRRLVQEGGRPGSGLELPENDPLNYYFGTRFTLNIDSYYNYENDRATGKQYYESPDSCVEKDIYGKCKINGGGSEPYFIKKNNEKGFCDCPPEDWPISPNEIGKWPSNLVCSNKGDRSYTIGAGNTSIISPRMRSKCREHKNKEQCESAAIPTYTFYDQVADFKPTTDSSLGCKENISLEQAQNFCNNADDCNGFFSYEGDSGRSGRVCFKNEFNTLSELNKITNTTSNEFTDNSGFYVLNPDGKGPSRAEERNSCAVLEVKCQKMGTNVMLMSEDLRSQSDLKPFQKDVLDKVGVDIGEITERPSQDMYEVTRGDNKAFFYADQIFPVDQETVDKVQGRSEDTSDDNSSINNNRICKWYTDEDPWGAIGTDNPDEITKSESHWKLGTESRRQEEVTQSFSRGGTGDPEYYGWGWDENTAVFRRGYVRGVVQEWPVLPDNYERPPDLPVQEKLLDDSDVSQLVNRWLGALNFSGGCNGEECDDLDKSKFMQYVYDSEFCRGNIDKENPDSGEGTAMDKQARDLFNNESTGSAIIGDNDQDEEAESDETFCKGTRMMVGGDNTDAYPQAGEDERGGITPCPPGVKNCPGRPAGVGRVATPTGGEETIYFRKVGDPDGVARGSIPSTELSCENAHREFSYNGILSPKCAENCKLCYQEDINGVKKRCTTDVDAGYMNNGRCKAEQEPCTGKSRLNQKPPETVNKVIKHIKKKFYRAVGSGECHLSDDDSDCFGKNALGIDRKLDTSDGEKNLFRINNLNNNLSEFPSWIQKLLNTESPLMVPDICCDNIDNSQNTAFIGCDASGHNPYFIDDILSGKNLNQCATLKGSSCYPLSNEDMLQRDKVDMCYKKTQNRDKDKLPDYEDLPENADIDQYFEDFKDFCKSSQSGEEDSPDKKGECGRFIPYNLPNFPHKKKLDSQWDEGSNETGKFRFTLPEPIYGENYNYCIESKQIDSGLNITDIDFLDKNFDWYIPESDYEKNYPLKRANDIASCDCCENPDASCNIQCDNNSSQKLRFIKIPDGGPLNGIPFWESPFGDDEPDRKGTDDPPDTLEPNNPYVNVQCKHGTKVKFGPREGPIIREANTEERKKIKEAREKDLSAEWSIKVGSIVKTQDNKVGIVVSIENGSLGDTGWVPDSLGVEQLAYLAFPGSTAACGKNHDQVCGPEDAWGHSWYNQEELVEAEDTHPGYEELNEIVEIKDFNVEEYYYPVQCCPTQEGMISMCDKKCGKTVSSDSWGSGNEDNKTQTNNRDGDDDDDSDDSDDEEFNIVILLAIAVVAGYFVDPLAGGSVLLVGIFIWVYQTYMNDE